MSDALEVGYIGLGAMGGAIARRVLETRRLHVFDRDPRSAKAFEALGAVVAESPEAVARDCDVIMICVPRSANVREVIFGETGLLAGLSPGKIVVDQTTGDPTETRRMAADLDAHGVTMVDAPVSGGPRGAKAGTIAIMVGGPDTAVEKIQSIFAAISPNVFRCGEIGSGQVMKLVNNTISACNRFAVLEAVSVGLKNGLDLGVMAEVLNSGGARSQVTEILLPSLVRGEQSAIFALALMLKDLNLATQLAIDSEAPLQLGQVTRSMLQAASHAFGPNANLDEIVNFVASHAGTSFGALEGPHIGAG